MNLLFFWYRYGFIVISALLFTACDWQFPGTYRETAVAPAGKNKIIINNGTEPESLDPQLVTGIPEIRIIKTLFEGLVRQTPDGKIAPAAALSWENHDDKVWIFRLRHDARWSDGSLVTATDFVYAWRRLINPQTASPAASVLTDNEIVNAKDISLGEKPPRDLGIYAVDPYTLKIVLRRPVPFFLATLDHPALYPLPAAVIARRQHKWTRAGSMVGNGPYQLKNWQVNNSISVVANPYYWNKKEVRNQGIIFLPIAALMSDVVNYIAGNEDMSAESVPPEIFAKLRRQYPNELKIERAACTYYYALNLTKPPFNDRRVRLALAMTLPREIITRRLLNMGQERAYTLTPYYVNNFTKITPQWAQWTLAERINTAKKLLAAAGYRKNHPLTFEILYNTLESHKSIALTAAAEWQKRLGVVAVKLKNQEWKVYTDSLRRGDFTMARQGSCAAYNDPSSFLLSFRSFSSDNKVGYNNKNYDDLLRKIYRSGNSSAVLADIYKAAEKILLTDVPVLVIYSYVNVRLVKNYIKGYKSNILGDIYFPDLELLKMRPRVGR